MFDIKLLLVEDDAIIRGVYQRVLENTVSRIISAANGEEGYNLFLREKPDLIITDIKMPVVNGLDMINKIRIVDKSVRIIIMSAYGESRYFINAIESGVKGFLTKPIKNDDLIKVISEQARDILLEKNLKKEEKKRKLAELATKKSDRILSSLSTITTIFLHKGLSQESIELGLKAIGEATESSRVVFYKFSDSKEGISAILENIWRADSTNSEQLNSNIQKLPLTTPTLLKWYNTLKNKGIIKGRSSEFTGPEKAIFRRIQSKSMLIIPVFVDEFLWGFISLGDNNEFRDWSKNEINAINSFAYNLGAAIYRKNADQELIHMNINLEGRVRERTLALESEIIERTNTQVLLRESEEKYRLIYENASDGILLVQNAKIVLVNPTMVQLMETMPRYLIGKYFHDFVVSKNKSKIVNFFSSYDNYKEETSLEVKIQPNKNSQKWLELKINGIDWDSEPGYLIFASDISLRKKAQQNLKKLNKGLEERIKTAINNVKQQQELLIQKSKLESLGELSAGLAHEINQPLGGISMGMENIIYKMTEGNLDNDYLINKINILFQDIDRIKNIIEHVRTFSRDQQNVSFNTIDVKSVIHSAISLINRQYENHQVELILELPDGEYHCMGNPFKLEQVFLNILSNAKSAVEKRLSRSPDKDYRKRIKITLQTDDEYIYTNISDNGVGMPREIMNKVFEPFFTTKDQESGTGLGLSISYGIIKEMNGVIRLESEENACTKLTIELPIIKN